MARIIEHDYRAMILSPDRWPMWPVLPLKRARRCGEMPDTAVVVGVDGENVRIVDGILFARETWTNERTVHVDTLLAEGWIVD